VAIKFRVSQSAQVFNLSGKEQPLHTWFVMVTDAVDFNQSLGNFSSFCVMSVSPAVMTVHCSISQFPEVKPLFPNL
jgi:hypothetical protein